MFSLWVFTAMVALILVACVLFAVAPRGETTRRSEAGMWAGLAAVFFGAVLALNWVIQGVEYALGF